MRALTADMVASATATVNGETVYPYEAGLAYYRTGDLVSTVDGTVISGNLVDYLQVAPARCWCASTGRRARASSSPSACEPGHCPGGAEEDCGGEPGNCNARLPLAWHSVG